MNNVREDEKVFELSKFQILVQKEGNLLNSDTQIHECRGRYSALLSPWVSPLSWLVKNLDKVTFSIRKGLFDILKNPS